ncbi:MAG TPA: hypothetical protein VGR35_18650 [Tepidisphaeraceae bacterium]|nr:hypothetical protein [Tepidisphaeraceae bacterium]
MFSATKPLVTRTLVRPVQRELPGNVSNKAAELAAAREALLDRRDAADRVIDSVVDRMLKELTW